MCCTYQLMHLCFFHPLSLGIAIEGLGTVLAGLWGSGNGTNTFGENVGAIGVTKVSVSEKYKTVVATVV